MPPMEYDEKGQEMASYTKMGNEMIVTPDIYLNNPNMDMGEEPNSVFQNMEQQQWMTSQPIVKQEPRDEGEQLPLTPPPSYPYQGTSGFETTPPEGTPPAPTPPASTPSPQEHGDGSSNSEGEYYESEEAHRRPQLANRTGSNVEEKLACILCDFCCSYRPHFNEHLKIHRFKCPACPYNEGPDEKLYEHMLRVHDMVDQFAGDEIYCPKVNAQGKVKTHRCRQCPFTAITRVNFWEHSRLHIPPDKILKCPRCPFVTEFKHHIEYHIRNHFRSKPYKCDECPYSCVNKSMLNSHKKSHNPVCQFRCADCNYETKYCHSLKLHLRKYKHRPAMVLNPDGTPNPLPIVDVYGTRRGPKTKPKPKQSRSPPMPGGSPPMSRTPPMSHSPPMPLTPPMATNMFNPFPLLPTQMPFFNILNGYPAFPVMQDVHVEEKNNNNPKVETREERVPLDLSCPEPMTVDKPLEEVPVKNKRKGKAFKLDTIALRLQQMSEEPPQQPSSTPEEVAKSPQIKSCEADSEQKAEKSEEDYTCTYCDISFKNVVMYTVHMGYHGFQEPFKCNMCGEQTTDKVTFFLHIARNPHS